MEYEKQFKFWRFTKVIRKVDHLNQNDGGIFITLDCFIFNSQLVLAKSALSASFTPCEYCCAYSIVCFPLISSQIKVWWHYMWHTTLDRLRVVIWISGQEVMFDVIADLRLRLTCFFIDSYNDQFPSSVLKLSNLFPVSDKKSVWLLGST